MKFNIRHCVEVPLVKKFVIQHITENKIKTGFAHNNCDKNPPKHSLHDMIGNLNELWSK